MKQTVCRILGLVALGVCLGVVSGMDYADAQEQEERYCRNVSEGVWPDYEGRYASQCPKK